MRTLLTEAQLRPARAGRPDVVAARSSMRTKHGGRAAIAWLDDHLTDDDHVSHLARPRSVTRSSRPDVVRGPGVLALTSARLIFVPDSLRSEEFVTLPLSLMTSVGWTRGRRTGDLVVANSRSTWEFRDLAAGDLRALVERLTATVPAAVESESPQA